ncbi:proteasome beta subunit [Tribonema minus]|uniref:Proteasome beta subunit n=1 Tax=Tribonema minus TaxID=303371 RepID=A0A835YVV6_9STRA|nr:proteasome beta subunit [Tribonema minus]
MGIMVCCGCTHFRRLLLVGAALVGAALAQQQSPLELNGGSCLVMAGRKCLAVAVDKRFGKGNELVSDNARRVLKLHSRLLCAFTGLTTDVQTLMQDLAAAAASYTITEGRPLQPAAAAALLSSMLYARRRSPYFCETIVAGLTRSAEAFVRSHDVLGAAGGAEDGFAVMGTSAESLYGLCEAFYRPDMTPEELADTAEHCLVAALERDCLSGHGVVVHLLTEQGISSRELGPQRQ